MSSDVRSCPSHDEEVRLVLEIVDFRPIDRNTASELGVTRFDLPLNLTALPTSSGTSIRPTQQDKLFSLVEIGDVAIFVDTSREVSGSCTKARTMRNDTQDKVAVLDRSGLDGAETEEDGNDERR